MPVSTSSLDSMILSSCGGVIPTPAFNYIASTLLVNIANSLEALVNAAPLNFNPVPLYPMNWLPTSSLSFTQIAASAPYKILLLDANPKLFALILNGTDADMWISFNGNTDHYPLDAGDSIRFDWAGQYKKHEGNIWVRYASVVPTTGLVSVSAYY